MCCNIQGWMKSVEVRGVYELICAKDKKSRDKDKEEKYNAILGREKKLAH
jgi:hypothetical protein